MEYDLTVRANACDLAMRYAMKGRSVAELAKTLRDAGTSSDVIIDARESFYFAQENCCDE